MRVQLAFPKIPGSKNCPSGRCVAFEKYDGTNLHWVWERELGWYAFGTRRNRFDFDETGIAEFAAGHQGLEEAPEIFRTTFADPLLDLFKTLPAYQCDEIVVFTEFLGENFFAGMHRSSDAKQLVLFDVQTENGLIGPEQFVEDFGSLNIARVVYRGKLTGRFIHDVREGKYDVVEGVICKGGTGGDELWMVKVKTNAYMEQLKSAFASDWEQYWE